jgi:hypothetical protein
MGSTLWSASSTRQLVGKQLTATGAPERAVSSRAIAVSSGDAGDDSGAPRPQAVNTAQYPKIFRKVARE